MIQVRYRSIAVVGSGYPKPRFKPALTLPRSELGYQTPQFLIPDLLLRKVITPMLYHAVANGLVYTGMMILVSTMRQD